jgi:hypothetical protein
VRKLFKGGNYSREETIRGNTVYPFMVLAIMNSIDNSENHKRLYPFIKDLRVHVDT